MLERAKEADWTRRVRFAVLLAYAPIWIGLIEGTGAVLYLLPSAIDYNLRYSVWWDILEYGIPTAVAVIVLLLFVGRPGVASSVLMAVIASLALTGAPFYNIDRSEVWLFRVVRGCAMLVGVGALALVVMGMQKRRSVHAA